MEQIDLKVLDDYIGTEVTYKKLTELLNMKYYKGDSKTRQLNEIQQYYRLEKNKTKYTIVEKYEEVIPIVDHRQSVYYDDLETTILYALKKSENTHNIWSVTEALIVTSLVNDNYRIGRKDIELTSNALNIDTNYLNSFYQSTHSRFKGVFESSLKRMQNKKLIDYRETTYICKKQISIIKNEFGIPKIDDAGKIQYNANIVHCEAETEEREFILKVQKNVLRSFKHNSISDLIMSGKFNEYKRTVDDILRKKANILYYYKVYDIVHLKDAVQEEINAISNYIATNSLNDIKIKALNDSNSKVLNKDLDCKELCIDILVNKYSATDLKEVLDNYIEKAKQEQELLEELDNLPF